MELNRIYCGDNRQVLKDWPESCIDAVVTDPPYELGFMGKSWDSTGIGLLIALVLGVAGICIHDDMMHKERMADKGYVYREAGYYRP